MSALPLSQLTPEEYLRLDREAEVKSEYYDGEVFPIEDSTFNHALVSMRLGVSLTRRLEGTPCQVLNPVRLRISATRYLYSDLIVVCGQPELTDEHKDALINPKVIVEVLSPSTADCCYGRKARMYRGLTSLDEYVLVSLEEPKIEVFHRTAEGDWLLRIASGLESSATIESLSIAVPLAEVYQGVAFG